MFLSRGVRYDDVPTTNSRLAEHTAVGLTPFPTIYPVLSLQYVLYGYAYTARHGERVRN